MVLGPARIIVEPIAWKGKGMLVIPEKANDAPKTAYRIVSKKNMVIKQLESLNGFEIPAKLAPGARYRMKALYRKDKLGVYENLAWKIDLELLAADGRTIASGNGYNIPDQYSLRDPRSLTKTTPWIWTEYVHFDVPPGPEVSKIRGKLYAAEYSHPPSGIKEDSVLELGPITIEPVGTIQRRREETFVAVVFPLKKDTDGPKVERRQKDGASLARIVWSKGTYDYLIVDASKPIEFGTVAIVAELALVRTASSKVQTVFAHSATSVVIDGVTYLSSPKPVDVSFQLDRGVVVGRIATESPVELFLREKEISLEAGRFVVDAEGKLTQDPSASSLTSNTTASQNQLSTGLKPLLDELVAERDKPRKKNLALGAKVTASGTRDPRFAPKRVIDNKTWEYPSVGRLDYTLGELKTSPLGGYGMGKTPLFGENMSSWPFYIPPTYWLLPYGKPGWIQLDLPHETPISLVRLLNTSNAGLNDYATIKYRVELLDGSNKVVSKHSGSFGRVFDRPFKQAFKYPQHFSRYSPTFDGMLEQGISVPFGDGWQDVKFKPIKAKSIKVYIDSHWAIGGGLNEIQVF